MIFHKSVKVVIEGIHRRSCQHAALSHGAAEQLAHAVGSLDRFMVAANDGSDRATQSFGKAGCHRVEMAGVLGGRDPRRSAGIPDARAIEMSFQLMFGSLGCHGFKPVQRPDRATTPVLGVLKTEQS